VSESLSELTSCGGSPVFIKKQFIADMPSCKPNPSWSEAKRYPAYEMLGISQVWLL
jgi:hypothetical protein